MATRLQYQQAVNRASTDVRAKTQTLNEAQIALAKSQSILADLQSRSDSNAQSILNAQLAVQREQNRVKVAGIELNQARTTLTSAQLELNSPDTVFDPDPPPKASDSVNLTPEQRNRLDQINEDRINKDLEPLLPGDTAALAAVNASFSAEQAARDRDTSTNSTVPVTDPAPVQSLTPSQRGEPLIDPDNGQVLGYLNNETGEISEVGTSVTANSPTTPAQAASSNTAADQVANTQGSVANQETLKDQSLRVWNELLVENGAAPVGIDDPKFNASYERRIASDPELAALAAAEERSNVESGRNTGTSTSDFIQSTELSEEQASRVTGGGELDEDYDEFQTLPGSDGVNGNPPQLKEGWTADGGYAVNISGVIQPPNSPTNTQVVQATSNIPASYVPSPNPLHAYASYTYGMSLHVMTDQEYTGLVNNPGSRFKPKITVISSANRYNTSGGTRDPAFAEDFYFQEFKMSTVIGLNHESRGGNTVNISFTLVEPYGMSLINRLLDLAVRLKKPNYVDIPYLLEINFFGADDTGKYANLENQTKLIPVRLLTIKFKTTTRGSEYQVTAIPYPHVASLQSLSATKANFEITSRTVGDFFKSKASDSAQVAQSISNTQRDQTQQQAVNARAQAAATANGGPALALSKPAPAKVVSSSFTDAFNIWNTQSVSHGMMKIADEISFEIDPEIANAKVVEPTKANPNNVAIQTGGLPEEQASPAANTSAGSKDNISNPNAPKAAGADFTRSIFNINAGTSIITVLNNIIINSTFITDQLANSETKPNQVNSATGIKKATGGKQNVKWFKITTKVELKGYDSGRGYSAKKLTYFVKAYTHYNVSSPDAPKSQPVGSVKNYDYIYTGKNNDIIDFNIEFNYLYNTLAVSDRSKQLALTTNPQAGSVNQTSGNAPIIHNFNVTPTQMNIQSGHQTVLTGGYEETSGKQQAAVLAENIYTGSAGDMLNCQIKILGDPQFIKQDEILFPPNKIPQKGSQFVDKPGGSLAMDSGEIFCKITFKTPIDINETTGLLKHDNKWKETYFSGIYKIMKVSSEFRQGKFTQDLTLIRHREQSGDSKSSVSSSSINSADQRAQPGDPSGRSTITRGDDGSALIEFGNGDRIVVDNTGNATQTNVDEGEFQNLNNGARTDTSSATTQNDDSSEEFQSIEPVTDTPTINPAGVVVNTTESGGSTVVVTNAGGAATFVGRGRPRTNTSRDVAVNGPTFPIDNNSSSDGLSVVGAQSSESQTATVDADSPTVQTQPRPAPATAAERQNDAATAEISELTAGGEQKSQRYAELFAEFKPKQDQLREYDRILDDQAKARENLVFGSAEYNKLLSLSEQILVEQKTLLDSTKTARTEMIKLRDEVDAISTRIRNIKANSGNKE